MSITKKDIEYIAELARLKLNENEIELYAKDLSKILEYIDKLNELDTDNLEPLSHPISYENVMRDDDLKPSIDREKALKNAPKSDEQYFKVPKVIKQN